MNPSLILCSILQGLILQNQTTPIYLRCLHLSTGRVILPFSIYFPCPVGSWVKFRWWWAWRWKSFQIRRRRRGKWISYLYFYYKGSHHPPKSDFWRRKNLCHLWNSWFFDIMENRPKIDIFLALKKHEGRKF